MQAQLMSPDGKQNQQFQHSKDNSLKISKDITKQQVAEFLKKSVIYDSSPINQTQKIEKKKEKEELKKPPDVKVTFTPFQLKNRLKDIMVRAYNKEELKLAQFQELSKFFRLNPNQIKLVSFPDMIILQTLRYAIYNKQQVPLNLVKVINQMAKTNLLKDWEVGYFTVHKAVLFLVLYEEFQPPLDLYLQFVDEGLIQASQQQLMEVFVRNSDFFNNKMPDNKQFYPTMSQKKRLVFNQFPYMIEIFQRINCKDSSCFNYAELKPYLAKIRNLLSLQTDFQLLERYLPEIKIRYLKIKQDLNEQNIKFLFVALKSLQDLQVQDLKVLYSTRPTDSPVIKQHKIKAWIQFWKTEQLCANLLNNKDYFLNIKELQSISDKLNYQKSCPESIIQSTFILTILREQCYYNQQFSKSVIRNVEWVFKNIPDKKKKRQCAYILILQYFGLLQENPKLRKDIMTEYTLPQAQLETILDEGRQIAINILLNLKKEKLTFNKKECDWYTKIVKDVINKTGNKQLKNRALDLYRLLRVANQLQGKDLKFYEQNILKTNQYIEFLQMDIKNRHQISAESVYNIIKILTRNNQHSIRKSCIVSLRYIIRNHEKGQYFPEKFQEYLIQTIHKLYFESTLSDQLRNLLVKLAVDSTYLIGSYALLDILMKFFLQVYSKSVANSPFSINSSYGIFEITLNFVSRSEDYYAAAKKFIQNFSSKTLKGYKNIFQPMNKGSINILCAVVALAVNQIQLPDEILQQLSILGLKNERYRQLVLMGLLLQAKNPKSKELPQKVMLNIHDIGKQDKNQQTEKVSLHILQLYFEKNIPSAIP